MTAFAALALLLTGCQSGADPEPTNAATARPLPPSTSASQAPTEPGTFRVASFNVLGAHHTRPGATGAHTRKLAVSGVRSALALRAIAAHRITLLGLQEFEPPQLRQWQRIGGGAWRFYPGLQRDPKSLSRSIAWRQDTWQLVRADAFTYPYFKGSHREAPAIVLRHRASGQELGMINVHNPANTGRFGDSSRWRREALRIERREIAKLRKRGIPVVVTGDFNAVRSPYCFLVQRAGLVAAMGTGPDRPCDAPPGAGVDWIFGTPDLTFTEHARVRGSLIRRASDHPIVIAAAQFPAA